jgi:AcrR family transcriptional regulator
VGGTTGGGGVPGSGGQRVKGSGSRRVPAARRGADAHKGLPRGPQALPREQVAAHQRERLMEAMVQVVDERGAVATTISDLVARAGISRRTFYEHFENKEACLLATYDAVVETEIRRLLEIYGSKEGEWLEQLEAVIRVLFGDIAERRRGAPGLRGDGASGEAGCAAGRMERPVCSASSSRGLSVPPGRGDPARSPAIVGGCARSSTRVSGSGARAKPWKTELMRLLPGRWSGSPATHPSPPGVPCKPRPGRCAARGRSPRPAASPRAVGRAGPAARGTTSPGLCRVQPARADLRRDRQATARVGYQALNLEDIAAAAASRYQTSTATSRTRRRRSWQTTRSGTPGPWPLSTEPSRRDDELDRRRARPRRCCDSSPQSRPTRIWRAWTC